MPSNLGIFSKALLILHFSTHFLSSFLCSLSSFILFLSSFCFSIALCSMSILSCLAHCFCKANRIKESVLCADGLLVGGYCGKYGGGTWGLKDCGSCALNGCWWCVHLLLICVIISALVILCKWWGRSLV